MQEDFGAALRHARVRKGLDINTVARRLRIRPDIIQAIEESDFERMPPRGYARNMINSYAQLVGLNPTDLTRQYLDAQYAYQVNLARKNVRGTGFDMSAADRRGGSRSTRNSQRMGGQTGQYEVSGYQRGDLSQPRNARPRDRYTVSDGSNRRMYDDYDSGRIMSREEADRTYRSGGHRSRSRALGEEPYLNAVASPSGMRGGGIASLGWPMIAVIAVAAILLIVLLVMIFGPKGGGENVESMPVSGVTETDAPASSTTAQAPTSFTFSYTVNNGTTTWIEVYIDGQQQLAENVVGPSTKTFTTSGELEFICADASGVKATQDGKDITLTPNENGVVDIKISFNDILAKWQQEHGMSVSTPSSSSSQSLRGIDEEGRAAASASTDQGGGEQAYQEEYTEEGGYYEDAGTEEYTEYNEADYYDDSAA